MRFEYEIEIFVTVDEQSDPLEVTIAGNDLYSLKKDITPTVKQICKDNGYTKGLVDVEIAISKNGEWYDSDEKTLNLEEI